MKRRDGDVAGSIDTAGMRQERTAGAPLRDDVGPQTGGGGPQAGDGDVGSGYNPPRIVVSGTPPRENLTIPFSIAAD